MVGVDEHSNNTQQGRTPVVGHELIRPEERAWLTDELLATEAINRALSTLNPDALYFFALTYITSGIGLGYNRATLWELNPKTGILAYKKGVGASTRNSTLDQWESIRRKGFSELQEYLNAYDELEPSGTRQITTLDTIVGDAKFPYKEDPLLIPVIEEGKPILVESGKLVEFMGKYMELDGMLAVVPVAYGDTTFGVMIADNSYTETPVEKNLRRLQSFAYRTAMSINSVHMHEELAEANATARAAEMVLELAHRFRNPLSAIGGFARRMIKDVRRGRHDRLPDYAEIIASELIHMETELTSVLNDGRAEASDINNLVKMVVTGLQEIYTPSFELQLDAQDNLTLNFLQLKAALMSYMDYFARLAEQDAVNVRTYTEEGHTHITVRTTTSTPVHAYEHRPPQLEPAISIIKEKLGGEANYSSSPLDPVTSRRAVSLDIMLPLKN